ncbi:MAG: hypothetical protein F6K14_07610 [Symploca sp. SIO2C1]|nr:hypothetical protein [Symploca sp. SIO2C1]
MQLAEENRVNFLIYLNKNLEKSVDWVSDRGHDWEIMDHRRGAMLAIRVNLS